MTLLEYRTAVRDYIDDSEYDADIIDREINNYIKEVCSRSRLRRFETSDELFLSIGDYEVQFPDDLQTLINLSVTSPTPARLIMDNYVAYNQFIGSNPGYQSVTSRDVAGADWTDYGNMIRLSAPASAATTIFCEYIRTPVLMENDDDESEIPDLYSEMVTIGSVARVMERNEDYAEAKQERGKLTPLETTFIKNEGRGQIKIGPNVISTRRGRAGGYRVDRDF